MNTLDKLVQDYLNEKNIYTFCSCGNRQQHNLVYCGKCGRKFSDGYKPKTIGDRIKWLIGKPGRDCVDPPHFYASIKYLEFKSKLKQDIKISDITDTIKKYLGLVN
jgi:hypothetical protein